ncbi:YfcE family phosphodiesterase [Microbacterium sp. zg.Y625]|uniref:metallophosphoesterase family protein n=1 Tax=Microbacterium jiangjiandongii TaxID=3049071 RepID=UPI00214B45D6|nr:MULTISPECIES: metallophosphoesterase family protein [unclassified Microbacterium]MCR2791905.1 YfcE family phosphodiesterase [Microbacterium sp. zg.Y625]MCR2815270.1 YfcE family phosphodiesterase [Microbacterium sp. zg.Y843]WIM24718.1 metallophosphoesterase family protein [Microbacterium sp. zg-Y625]
MSTRLLMVSDTHIPGRARRLPDALLHAADAADLVIHAGDWVAASVLDELERHAPVLGVYGNNDGADLRDRLPEIARREIDGVRVAVIHETGDARRRETRMDAAFADADLLVFGHSHIPWDTTTPGGLRLLNPGSPTDRRRQPHHTMMTAELDAGELRDVRLVTL